MYITQYNFYNYSLFIIRSELTFNDNNNHVQKNKTITCNTDKSLENVYIKQLIYNNKLLELEHNVTLVT